MIGDIPGYNPRFYGRRPRLTDLPLPDRYYKNRLTKFSCHGRWARGCCPFHEDQHPSLSVNLDHGGFRCHACGATGGNIVAFEMRLTGERYAEALQRLAKEGL